MSRPPRFLRLAAILMVVSGAAWGQDPAWRMTVYDHLARGNCARAAEALRSDLERPNGPVLLLAGWLSQWGYCIERSADKAWAFYERAHAAGEPTAAMRLAGLAATSAGGADVAAVLWWARRTQGERRLNLRDCDPFPGQTDVAESAFVDALQSWPQDKLLRCRNQIGYSALLSAELLYPLQALRLSYQGVVRLTYDVHKRRVQVKALDKPVAEALLRHVETVGTRAVLEMPPSPSSGESHIDVDFQIQ